MQYWRLDNTVGITGKFESQNFNAFYDFLSNFECSSKNPSQKFIYEKRKKAGSGQASPDLGRIGPLAHRPAQL
jgi:hypothetical protein